MKHAYQLIIFDWDGTILDSAFHIIDCMQKAQKSLDLAELSPYQIRQIIGLGIDEAIRVLHPKLELTIQKELATEYRNQFLYNNPMECHTFEGMEDLLIALKSKGYKLAVATGKSRLGLNKVLADKETGLGHLFDTTRCADETKSKPNPLMLKEIVSELKVPIKNCLMVGDTTFDLDMARAIKMDHVAMTYGAHDQALLESRSPMKLFHNTHDLKQWLLA